MTQTKTIPKAANMFKFHYNVTLQAYAEKWVNQCKLAHSGGPYGRTCGALLTTMKVHNPVLVKSV